LPKRNRINTAGLALVILALAAVSIVDNSSGFASLGGPQNAGFELGLSPWTITSADAGLVVGTETALQCPTYTSMGVAGVQPYKGTKSLRLGGCKKISESQTKGTTRASQTFTAVGSRFGRYMPEEALSLVELSRVLLASPRTRTQAGRPLQRAIGVLSRMGAALDLQDARDLLEKEGSFRAA